MATALFFGGAAITDTVEAHTVDQLKKKQSDLKDERSKVKKDLTKAEAEIADLLFDLEDLNEEIKQLDDALDHNKKALKETEENIANLEDEIAGLEKNIEELQARIDHRTEILKDRISSYQKTGGNINLLDVILGSKNFGDLVSRVSAVTKITNADQDLIDQQEADQAEVVKQQKAVEEKLDEQNYEKVELEGIEQIIIDQQEVNEKNRKKLKKEEEKLKKLVSKLKNEDRSLAQLEAAVRNELEAARNPVVTTLAVSNSGNNNGNSGSNGGNSKPAKPVSGGSNAAINAGYQHLGVPYRSAGKTPAGFDCSGFVSWAYAQAGYNIPSNTTGLSQIGTKVSYSDAKPGDLIFFNTYKTNGHVGIYLGGGKFLGSQNSTGLAVASVSNSYWNSKFSGHVRRIN